MHIRNGPDAILLLRCWQSCRGSPWGVVCGGGGGLTIPSGVNVALGDVVSHGTGNQISLNLRVLTGLRPPLVTLSLSCWIGRRQHQCPSTLSSPLFSAFGCPPVLSSLLPQEEVPGPFRPPLLQLFPDTPPSPLVSFRPTVRLGPPLGLPLCPVILRPPLVPLLLRPPSLVAFRCPVPFSLRFFLVRWPFPYPAVGFLKTPHANAAPLLPCHCDPELGGGCHQLLPPWR